MNEKKTKCYSEQEMKCYRYIQYIMNVTNFKLPAEVESPMPHLENWLNNNSNYEKSNTLIKYYLEYFLENGMNLTSVERTALQTARFAVALTMVDGDEELSKLIDSIQTSYYNNRGPVDKLFHEFER